MRELGKLIFFEQIRNRNLLLFVQFLEGGGDIFFCALMRAIMGPNEIMAKSAPEKVLLNLGY